MPSTAFVGLGSNVGDRLGMIAAGLIALDSEPGTRVSRVSHVYESEPWGVADQPPFADAVASVEFEGQANELLEVMQRIEEGLGRVREERFGPRTIDLDLLLFGDEEWASPELTLPHPRMLGRDFVVTPLLEIAPDVRLPDGRAIDRSIATEGRVLGVLGAVPGYEGRTGPVADAGPDGGADGNEDGGEEAHDEWVEVGPSRFEANAPNTSTDFELLFYEGVLAEAGIPSKFHPHRPNEGFATFPGIAQRVTLMVPASRAREARELIEAVDAAPRLPPE